MGGRVIPAAPSRLRRFDHPKGTRGGRTLPIDHPAILESRTLFPKSRKQPVEVRLLKSGHNSSKIGKQVTKGKWRGMPIYTLTLEERATCPATCGNWFDCYGNSMHWAHRIGHGPEFERLLRIELDALQKQHRGGFVVRLHVLGDFYSLPYVALWLRALIDLPALRVFGYTARDPHADPIGAALWKIATYHFDRFALRFSGVDLPKRGAVTIAKGAASKHVVCPAQTGKTECCGTCGFCWASQRTIAFEKH